MSKFMNLNYPRLSCHNFDEKSLYKRKFINHLHHFFQEVPNKVQHRPAKIRKKRVQPYHSDQQNITNRISNYDIIDFQISRIDSLWIFWKMLFEVQFPLLDIDLWNRNIKKPALCIFESFSNLAIKWSFPLNSKCVYMKFFIKNQ